MSERAKLEWLRSILPVNRWTPLATRPRYWPDLDEPAPWTPLPDAPITVATAWELEERGLLFRALRYTQDELEVVVLPRREPAPKKEPLPAGKVTEWNENKSNTLRRLWHMVEDGRPVYTIAQIGELLNAEPESVRSKAARMNLPARGKSSTREQLVA